MDRGPWTNNAPHRVFVRVLSGIYRLGEKSRVSEDDEFPRGVRGMPPPEIFLNECALRWNLVPFETILRNVTVCVLTSSRLDDFSDIVYCTDDNIFGGES